MEQSAKQDGKGKTRQRSALAALGQKRGRYKETGKQKAEKELKEAGQTRYEQRARSRQKEGA
jgi:hypothetical protein